MKIKITHILALVFGVLLGQPEEARSQSVTVGSYVERTYGVGNWGSATWDITGMNGLSGLAFCLDGNAATPPGPTFELRSLDAVNVLSLHDHAATEGGAAITAGQRDLAMWRANYFVDNYWNTYATSADWKDWQVATAVLREIFMDATNPLSGAISSPTSQTPGNQNVISDWSGFNPNFNPALASIITDINANVTGAYTPVNYYLTGLDTTAGAYQSLVFVSPVPEPSTSVLFAGLGMAGLLRRKRIVKS